MRAEPDIRAACNIVIVTLDMHAAGPAARITPRLQRDFPGLSVTVHAAAEWAENPASLARAKSAVEGADIVIANLLFIEEHLTAIVPSLQAASARADAFVGLIADPSIVKLTHMGDLDLGKPASGAMAFLKKLRPKSSEGSSSSGAKQMSLLRRPPKILRWIPGRAQDLRGWFLSMQCWLGGSDDNIEQMVRFLVSRHARLPAWKGAASKAPVDCPDVGVYHPRMTGRIGVKASDLPRPATQRAPSGCCCCARTSSRPIARIATR